MATSGSPGASRSESPSAALGRPDSGSRRTARSMPSSYCSTDAGRVRPSRRRTSSDRLSATTWALVTTSPVERTIMPDPSLLAVETRTTEGNTRATAPCSVRGGWTSRVVWGGAEVAVGSAAPSTVLCGGARACRVATMFACSTSTRSRTASSTDIDGAQPNAVASTTATTTSDPPLTVVGWRFRMAPHSSRRQI